ncbi:MAG: extracellular solute-binding protein [Tissierellales bacterium]|nr:extracellular solute-binding protein [Tissierellales bacterium]MBN2827182.1 extracellular solute-binding protein [Tissierellales bacterium]
MKNKHLVFFVIVIIVMLATIGCNNEKASDSTREVVVYTSVDQNIAESILKDFEATTGIVVKPVYDIEASKTTGLANRLIAEKENPQADVFWSSEIIMTLRLKEENVFQPYASEKAADIPASYKDSEGYWTGFGGRGRVMIINTDIMGEATPDSIYDLISEEYSRFKKAIAYPLFGTTMTHLFVMNQLWGEEAAINYFLAAEDNQTVIVDGNSVVRDLVASGEVAFGITDTDDAFAAVKDGKPVKVVYLDQKNEGTLIIPNTVGMIQDCRHPEEGKIFIDYLLSKETEQKLMEMGFIDVSLNDATSDIVFLTCDFEEAYRGGEAILEKIKDALVQ